MAWTIEFEARAERDLERLDRPIRARIVSFLEHRVAIADDPASLAEPLKGRFAGKWRFRVGDWRVVCRIERERITVLVIAIGHRREVYG